MNMIITGQKYGDYNGPPGVQVCMRAQREIPLESPNTTKLAQAATAVATTSPESRMPIDGRLGLVSVTYAVDRA